MVNFQPFWVATPAFRNPDIGLQTGVVHGRHQERCSCERTKASKNDSKITRLPMRTPSANVRSIISDAGFDAQRSRGVVQRGRLAVEDRKGNVTCPKL